MIVRIVGFKVGQSKSTCSYRAIIPEDKTEEERKKTGTMYIYKKEIVFSYETLVEKILGHYMRLALEKSDFVSVRK